MEIKDEKTYKMAMARLEELNAVVDENTPKTDPLYIELDELLDALDAYEDIVYPIPKPSFIEVLKLRMYEMGLTQLSLSNLIGVSPSSISNFLLGKSEPTISVARKMSQKLNIDPAIVLGV